MRTSLFFCAIALLATACTSTPKPVDPTKFTVHPEAPGTDPNPAQQGKAFSISTEALYQATIASPKSAKQVISLNLTPDRHASLMTDFMDKSPLRVDVGEWSTLNNGNLLVHLHRAGQKDSMSLEFMTDGDKLVYTGDLYGNAGLTLWVKHVPN